MKTILLLITLSSHVVSARELRMIDYVGVTPATCTEFVTNAKETVENREKEISDLRSQVANLELKVELLKQRSK